MTKKDSTTLKDFRQKINQFNTLIKDDSLDIDDVIAVMQELTELNERFILFLDELE